MVSSHGSPAGEAYAGRERFHPTGMATRLRVSGSPRPDAAGTELARGLSTPVRETPACEVADATYGGPSGPGLRRVYAQVRGAAGNWSEVFFGEIVLLAPPAVAGDTAVTGRRRIARCQG